MQIKRDQIAALLDLAGQHHAEVCGVLIGRRDPLRLARIMPGRNVHEQPHQHFLLDAATLLAADQDARGMGDTIIGFYHSHPNGGATPSQHDRAAAWPDAVYLIIAVDRGQAHYICAWRWTIDGALLPIAFTVD